VKRLIWPLWLGIVLPACGPHTVPIYAAIGGDTSFADQYRHYLQADLAEAFVLVEPGHGSSTSAQLMAAIRDDASVSGALAMARAVTVSIGDRELREARSKYKRGECGGTDNQDCLRATVRLFDRYWSEIAAGVLRHVPRAAAVRALELHHPWVAEDKQSNSVADDLERDVRGSDFEIVRDYLRQLNVVIRRHAEVWNIRVADVYRSINGTVGSDDPIAVGYIDEGSMMLTTKGQAQIALALRRLGYSPTPEAFTLDGR
jgi:hypothetical protein